ncbi:hypothetical protein KAI04_00875 [Candidatus Pacearchaeota archaeon]|nr:hypothetical protein [Candidatus Pacearchaeota archaeon]
MNKIIKKYNLNYKQQHDLEICLDIQKQFLDIMVKSVDGIKQLFESYNAEYFAKNISKGKCPSEIFTKIRNYCATKGLENTLKESGRFN